GEPVAKVLRDVTAEVDGRRYQVKLWVPDLGDVMVAGSAPRATGPKRPKSAGGATGSGRVAVPMQGTIVKVTVAVGDEVELGQTVCVLEAMKMENNVVSEKAGTVKEVMVAAGDAVGPGDVVAIIE
ncbi:MAG TPA: biotin/lipoyl-containing protein, partial [Acidimicrobiales bacterium]|nr:biotin/lipoyl-containing protein [Acidimicrobiales bacterium]